MIFLVTPVFVFFMFHQIFLIQIFVLAAIYKVIVFQRFHLRLRGIYKLLFLYVFLPESWLKFPITLLLACWTTLDCALKFMIFTFILLFYFLSNFVLFCETDFILENIRKVKIIFIFKIVFAQILIILELLIGHVLLRIQFTW